MIYTQLFDRYAPGKVVRAGIIGTGHYATAIVTQSFSIPRLEVPVVADLDPATAAKAFERAGVPAEDIVICESRAAALQALEQGKRVVLRDALLMMDLPIDAVVHATASAAADAVHASEAIRHGKHVIMVGKECCVTIGPMLKRLADQAGVVYTNVDGDQPGLLMGLVGWARELGLEVLCGIKFRDTNLTYDGGALWKGSKPFPLPQDQLGHFAPIRPGQAREMVEGRQGALGQFGEIGHFDYEELTIAANATGLAPDADRLHRPALRTTEIPEVLSPVEEGGILGRRGVIEMVTNLRHADEADGGGGVAVVVTAATEYSRYILATKGCISNSRGTTALIYRPYHLCGVETPMSILCAGLLGLPTGTIDYQPRFDVIAEVVRGKKAGESLEYEDVRTYIRPAGAVDDGAPLSLHLALWTKLAVDVAPGTIITRAHVAPAADSVLWKLRREQDRLLLHK
ncbi:MAG: flagellar biosynthesis protein FlgA [Chloroflexi bacterium]|nr:flagellar biosynthesis protein FlgA [Chloroflexota bacterium]